MMIIDKEDLKLRDLVVGTLYSYNTGEIRAEVLACEESMRIRLTFLGFEEDLTMPNTYWLTPKEKQDA
jgi:hypothetical protein